jgi:chromosome segregation ATPase
MKGKGPIVIAAILAILLLISGWWGWQQSKQKQQYQTERDELNQELSSLNELKANLEMEVDSLESAYTTLAEENESLQGSLAEAQSQISRQRAAVRAAQNNAAAEVNNLKAEIQALLEEKDILESSIFALQSENDSLRTLAGTLERDLSIARDENTALNNLNQAIQEELNRLTLANFKATAFQVELERRSSKVTARSGRARRIRVSFDLTNVPEEYQGVRPLYLTISDEKATPIEVSNPIRTSVIVNGQEMNIQAVEAKEMNITSSQRLTFTHELDEKLSAGYYRAAVYTDIGLLGAASFRLQ